MDTNYIHITGTVKADVEARRIREGLQVMDFTLSVRAKGKPTYIDCMAYGDVVDGLEGFVERGERLDVEGNLTFRTFTDRNGEMTTKNVVYVERAKALEE